MTEAMDIINKQCNIARLERERAIQEQGAALRLAASFDTVIAFHNDRVESLTDALELLAAAAEVTA